MAAVVAITLLLAGKPTSFSQKAGPVEEAAMALPETSSVTITVDSLQVIEHSRILHELLELVRKENESTHVAEPPCSDLEKPKEPSSKTQSNDTVSGSVPTVHIKPKTSMAEPIERLLARAREEGYASGWNACKAVGYKIGIAQGKEEGLKEGRRLAALEAKEKSGKQDDPTGYLRAV